MAQTISPRFQTQLSNNLRWARGYLWNLENNAYMYDTDLLISFKITTNLQKDANIYGNTICKYAEVKAKNPGNLIRPEMGHRVHLYTGLTLDYALETEDVEYLDQGVFTLYDVKYDEDNESMTTYNYDDMVKFNVKYYENGNVYPMTLANFAASLCTRVGLELGNTVFPNSTLLITQPNVAANEYTFRDILGWAAELAGGNALIGRDNKVYIKTYSDAASVFTITPDIYIKLKRSPVFGPVNAVAMVREALGDTVAFPEPVPLNAISYKIIDNMVAYDQREVIIETIYNEVLGMTYTPFELDWRATGHLDFMDKITITDTNAVSFDTYVMNQTIYFDGALHEELNAVAYTAAASAIINSGTSKTKGKLTEAKVNKVDGEISLIASEVSDLGEDVSQLILDVSGVEITVADHTGAISSLGVSVDAIEGRVTSAEGDISTLSLTTNGLEISVQDYEDGKLSGAKYTFDGSAATFYGGGLTIKNTSNVDVLKADLDGNLTIKGTLDAVGGTFTGNLSAATGSFSGTVSTGALTATGGTVGGWNITSNSIYKGNTKLDATNDRLYLNTNASFYGYASGTIGVSGDLFLGTAGNTIKVNDSNGFVELGNGGITAFNASNGFKSVNLNGNPILTTASAASASTRGGIKLEYDPATNTLNIYN